MRYVRSVFTDILDWNPPLVPFWFIIYYFNRKNAATPSFSCAAIFPRSITISREKGNSFFSWKSIIVMETSANFLIRSEVRNSLSMTYRKLTVSTYFLDFYSILFYFVLSWRLRSVPGVAKVVNWLVRFCYCWTP